MKTRKNVDTSIQVSYVGNIPAGDFEANGEVFLIKNITDNNLTVTIQPLSSDETISTVLYPGWNVELCKKIIGATANTLQYGY